MSGDELPLDDEGLHIVTKVRGSTLDRIDRPLQVGERIVLALDCRVKSITNDEGTAKSGPQCIRLVMLSDAFELAGGPELMVRLREQHRQAADDAAGRLRIPFGEDEGGEPGPTRSAIGGNLATPDELADFLNLPPDPTVVVVLDGGERHRWPSDWDEAGTDPGARPTAGQDVTVPGGKRTALVVELVDSRTGETLEQHTPVDDAFVAEAEAWWSETFATAAPFAGQDLSVTLLAVAEMSTAQLDYVDALIVSRDHADGPRIAEHVTARRRTLAGADARQPGAVGSWVENYADLSAADVVRLVKGGTLPEPGIRSVLAHELAFKNRKRIADACRAQLDFHENAAKAKASEGGVVSLDDRRASKAKASADPPPEPPLPGEDAEDDSDLDEAT